MALTSKQRAELRGIANGYDTLFQAGKKELGETFYKSVRDALDAREMIKIRVLNANELSVKEVAAKVTDEVGADVVQVIGTRIILYKQNPDVKKRKIELKTKGERVQQ